MGRWDVGIVGIVGMAWMSSSQSDESPTQTETQSARGLRRKPWASSKLQSFMRSASTSATRILRNSFHTSGLRSRPTPFPRPAALTALNAWSRFATPTPTPTPVRCATIFSGESTQSQSIAIRRRSSDVGRRVARLAICDSCDADLPALPHPSIPCTPPSTSPALTHTQCTSTAASSSRCY